MRLLLVLLLLAGCGLSATTLAQPCTVLNEYEVRVLRTIALETELDKLTAVEGTFTVRDIRIVRQKIFPTEDHLLARQANRFHSGTKEAVLRAALPFEKGQVISQSILKEAERILRTKPYLFDARVFVRQVCDGQADVDVVVRDVWTLTPHLDFNRAGGDNEFGVGLSDLNLFGSGREVELIYQVEDERQGINAVLRDPNIFGSHWTTQVAYSDNDDGHRYRVNVSLPFYSLDSRFSTGFRATEFDRVEGLYLLHDKLWEIEADSELLRTFIGFSKGRTGRWVDRLFVGTAYQHDEFEYPVGFPEPGVPERTFVYPYVAWQRVEDKFVSRTNTNRIGRTEDIGLGIRSYLEVGWSPESFGGIGDYLLGRVSLSGAWYLTDNQLLNVGLEFSGRYELDEKFTEEAILTVDTTYRWQHHDRWVFFIRANYTQTRNLPVHRQLRLGGDTGMRGYPSRYQIGDRRYLLTLEERYFTNLKPFGLFRVGWAVFFDAGKARFRDAAPAWVPELSGDHFDTLFDVGVGLRLESVRTRRDRVIHFDIAKPLVDGPGVDSFEVTITAKRSF